MQTKIVKNYIYTGLGFPIKLKTLEMVLLDNEWHPKIDIQTISDEIIISLAIQESRLTGNQIKFIRSYYNMTLREFASKVVHESHMAVHKWEKSGDSITKMNVNTEHELRLFVIEMMYLNKPGFTKKFYKFYLATKKFFSCNAINVEPLSFDLATLQNS